MHLLNVFIMEMANFQLLDLLTLACDKILSPIQTCNCDYDIGTNFGLFVDHTNQVVGEVGTMFVWSKSLNQNLQTIDKII